MNAPATPSHHQWRLSIPFKFHWFFVILTALVIPWLTRNLDVPQRGEWYPFSNFPMYSNFEPQAYYVYVTDDQDKPVAIQPTFGTWPTAVKKAYDLKLKAVVKQLKADAEEKGEKYKKKQIQMTGEECRPAGDATLKQIMESSRFPDEVKKHRGYRLYQMDIWLGEDGRIEQKPKLVGEI